MFPKGCLFYIIAIIQLRTMNVYFHHVTKCPSGAEIPYDIAIFSQLGDLNA